jgi:DNA-binding CsgD family transcriptional regulator/sugar-specific transcriptional regulator TrmB
MPATSEEVQTAIGLQPAEARAALTRLEEMGFAYRLAGEPVRFVAASPGMIDAAIGRKLAELQQARESLGQIAGQYGSGGYSTTTTRAGVFEVIRGKALRECFLDMLSSARSEVINMVKPPTVAVSSQERAKPSESVRGRLIFDRASVADGPTLDAIRQGLSEHEEIRVHSKVPMKLLAIDRRMALLPIDNQDASVGILIGESVILDSLLALFDYVWDTAVRFDVAADGVGTTVRRTTPLDDADRRLLSLLLAGLTDEAIAAHMGVSVRTVERKARALMDTAHVRTRVQLAWEAARQKWL